MRKRRIRVDGLELTVKGIVLDKDGVLVDQTALATDLHQARRSVVATALGTPAASHYDHLMGAEPFLDPHGPSILASLAQADVLLASLWYQYRRDPWAKCMRQATWLMAEADRLVDGASVQALPGAQAFVARVRAAGLFLGLVTGDHRARTMAHLRALQLETSFDAVVTADDSVLQKPDPAPLRLVLHGQSWDPGDCVMVGDSCNDWTMAQALAIPVIAIGSEVIHHPAVIRTVPDLRSIWVTGAIEEDQIVTHTRDASTTL